MRLHVTNTSDVPLLHTLSGSQVGAVLYSWGDPPPRCAQDRADRARRKGCRAQKEEKERKKGKESLWLLEPLVRKIILQMHTPARTSQCWSRQTPARTRSVHLDAPGQRHGQQPVSGTADLGVVKQDKSSRGFVDTTKTRLGPQRVRMSGGERPIGAAKGKQSDTETLCPPPPPGADCMIAN